MAEAIIILILFNLIFFRKFYFQNPFCFATSELASTAFPSSRLLGEAIRKCKLPEDQYYYPYYSSIPFLSTFYPPHMLQAYMGNYINLDTSYVLYIFTLLAHFFWASLGGWVLFSNMGLWPALFGAISIAYMGYCIKQNGSIIYTLAWMPWLLAGAEFHDTTLFGVSLGAMILAGYWPIGIYGGALACLYWLLH